MVQGVVATGCILTADRCGLLPLVGEGTVCAGDRICADHPRKCRLVGIRGRKWPRRWDAGMGRRLNKDVILD